MDRHQLRSSLAVLVFTAPLARRHRLRVRLGTFALVLVSRRTLRKQRARLVNSVPPARQHASRAHRDRFAQT